MSDYDNAPTNPHHGGKLMPHQMPQRIEALEVDRDEWRERAGIKEALALGYAARLADAEDNLAAFDLLYAQATERRKEAEAERDLLAREVERLTAALKPFAGVPMRGTCGGPMTGATVNYEDGSEHGISPDFPGYIPKECFARARAALNPEGETPLVSPTGENR